MKVIQTATLDASTLDDDARLHVYNGLDCCITTEVFEALASKVPEAGFAYNVERALQATAFALMRRGIKVDMEERGLQAAALRARLEAALRIWNRLTKEAFDLEVNPASPTQLLRLFYAVMGLRPVNVFNKQTKDYGPSTSREALEKLEEQWRAKPFVSLLLEMRSIGKQLEVLSKGVRDGRMHCSFHPAGTLSGRWASSEDPFGSGGNAQNISDEMRGVFVADEGYKLCYMDLKQAEALCVAYLALPWGDNYLKACLSGDPHTAVAKMLWPQLKSKADAQQPFYRHFSFRDMAKRGTHLCLSSDHEVLTPVGWVSIAEKPEEIMTFFNEGEGSMAFMPVVKWTEEHYKGKMIELDGQALSIKMTPNHRVLATTDKKLAVHYAEELPRSAKIPLGWGYSGNKSVRLARFLAAFHSDGRQSSTNRCLFHLRKPRKIARLKEICDDLRLEMYGPDNFDQYVVKITLPKDKKETWPDFSWDGESLDTYILEYLHWDGNTAVTSQSICTTKKDFCLLYQTLARLRGWGGNYYEMPTYTRQDGSTGQGYKLQLNNRRFAKVYSKKVSNEDCKIYCPTTASGFFLVRRKGKISITGNSNYGGKPAIMVKHLKIELAVAEKFQALLFSSFPEIRQWQANVAARLVRDRSITTALGRKCWFPGRPWDPEVIKRAIAYEPQSLVADTLNRGMYRVWKKYDVRFGGPIQLLLQVHDAILFQYPEALEATLLPAIAADLVVPFEVNGQTCAIGVDSHVGWNWGHRIDKADGTAKNPYGLVEWKGRDERHAPPKRSLLDRPANSFVQLAQLPCNLPSLVGYRHH